MIIVTITHLFAEGEEEQKETIQEEREKAWRYHKKSECSSALALLCRSQLKGTVFWEEGYGLSVV